jgi:hypothetical protein
MKKHQLELYDVIRRVGEKWMKFSMIQKDIASVNELLFDQEQQEKRE